MPKILKEFLEDPDITFVGVGIKGDATRLENAFEVEIPHVIDVALLAVERKMQIIGKSLNQICGSFLKRQLRKDNVIRISQWNQPLSTEQINYACLDSYASILCYQHIDNHCDPIWKSPPQEIEVGRRVQLYLKASSAVVAYGILVDHKQQRT